MSYRDDQFYRLDKAEDVIQPTGDAAYVPAKSPDNPPFYYPDNTVRTQNPDGSASATKLKRGYIRSLFTEFSGIQVPIRKCGFQFNPRALQQRVEMNPNMLSFFQQSASEMMQPTASEVAFSFDLFFDRTMEMNNPKSTDNKGDEDNPWETGSPSQVGILADIAAFYAVIGQGVSETQKEFAKAAYGQRINTEARQNQTNSIPDAAGTSVSTDPSEALRRSGEFIDVNVGNTAFLHPLPVRVMFSSLYMVEGMVNSTNVVYTKFSSTMVPMQATMSVTMRAMYIGFASRDTWVTQYLQEAIEAEKQAELDVKQTKADGYNALIKELGVIKVRANRGYTPDDLNPVDSLIGNSLEELTEFDTGAESFIAIKMELPNGKKDGVLADFLGIGDANISFKGKFVAYGPFDSKSEIGPNGLPAGGLPSIVPALISVSAFSGEISSTSTSSGTAASWEQVLKNGVLTSSDSRGKSSKTWSSLYNTPTMAPTGKWFTYVIDVNITVKVGSDRFTGYGKYIGFAAKAPGGNVWTNLVDYDIPINWGNSIDQAAGLPPIAATESTAPTVNAPSKVGEPPVVPTKPSSGNKPRNAI
jgi:hypothetical protein